MQAGFDINTATSTGANTIIGYNTGRGITTGINNTILGANVTGLAAGLSNNIILADGAGNQRLNIDASGNVGIGTTTPVSTLSIQGSLCVRDTGTCGTAAGTIYATTAAVTDIDLAENYPVSDPTLRAGEIVALDRDEVATIKRASGSDTPIGIISTAPGLLLGQDIKNSKPVALKGRVPLKVNNEGGDIKVGDTITLSSVPGVGMKATTTTYTVAIALEDSNGSRDTIEVFIQNQTFFSKEASAKLSYLLDGVPDNAEDETDTIWSRLTTLANNFVAGVLQVTGLRTDELCVGNVCVDEADFLQMVEQAGSSPQAPSSGSGGSTSGTPPSGNTGTAPEGGSDSGEIITAAPENTEPEAPPPEPEPVPEPLPLEPAPGPLPSEPEPITEQQPPEPVPEPLPPEPEPEPEPEPAPEPPPEVVEGG
jgi:hypothetical protein